MEVGKREFQTHRVADDPINESCSFNNWRELPQIGVPKSHHLNHVEHSGRGLAAPVELLVPKYGLEADFAPFHDSQVLEQEFCSLLQEISKPTGQ